MKAAAKTVGRIVGRGLEVVFALIGGLVWILALSLIWFFLFRVQVLSIGHAVVAVVLSVFVCLVAAISKRRLFACFAVPVLELITGDESDTGGPKIDRRVILGCVSIFVAVAALSVAVAARSYPSAALGVVALCVYAVVAMRLSAAVPEEKNENRAQPGATDNPGDAQRVRED